jgi:UDP-N-acetylmuramyl tripeptide synthase
VNYGYAPKLAGFFPNDDELHGVKKLKKSSAKVDVELKSFTTNSATYEIAKRDYSTKIAISGAHNLFNAAGALALVRAILGSKVDDENLVKSLSTVKSAFGRGEKLVINHTPVELILVKNPAGFRLSLKSQYSPTADVLIAINDAYADGRDMSWLWDVDFRAVKSVAVVSGVRAYDMALRLQYDDVEIGEIEPDFKKAIDNFLNANPSQPKQIFCTYTAMLTIRKILSKLDKVERAL